MKLQISFDITNIEEALKIAHQVEPHCDQFEVGSLMLYAFGTEAIRAFKKEFPHKKLIADAKIIDRSAEIIELLSHAGADQITVMGSTNKNVLYTAVQAAQQQNVRLMLDLIDAASPGQIAMTAQTIGINTIIAHKPHDEAELSDFLDQWDMIRGNTKLPIFIAATITRENIAPILALKPDGIIIGQAITQAKNPAQEAEYFYGLCNIKTNVAA